jgi:hypothetical protein
MPKPERNADGRRLNLTSLKGTRVLCGFEIPSLDGRQQKVALERKTEGDCLLAITSREIEETLYCMRLESGEPFGWRIMGEGMEA